MSTLKATLLALGMVCAICVCGIGIYAADAANDHQVVDGYGVVARN